MTSSTELKAGEMEKNQVSRRCPSPRMRPCLTPALPPAAGVKTLLRGLGYLSFLSLEPKESRFEL